MPDLSAFARGPRTPAEASLGEVLGEVLETALDWPTDLVTPTDPLAALLREAVVAQGWRPPPRVIRLAADMDALPTGTIVESKVGTVAIRDERGRGACFGAEGTTLWSDLILPATVLREADGA